MPGFGIGPSNGGSFGQGLKPNNGITSSPGQMGGSIGSGMMNQPKQTLNTSWADSQPQLPQLQNFDQQQTNGFQRTNPGMNYGGIANQGPNPPGIIGPSQQFQPPPMQQMPQMQFPNADNMTKMFPSPQQNPFMPNNGLANSGRIDMPMDWQEQKFY